MTNELDWSSSSTNISPSTTTVPSAATSKVSTWAFSNGKVGSNGKGQFNKVEVDGCDILASERNENFTAECGGIC